MPFKRTPQVYSSSVNEVTFGTGDRAVTIGGENVMPYYTFDAPMPHKTAIGIEITDLGVDRSVPGIAAYYDGAKTLGEIAKRASQMDGIDFVVLTFKGADPAETDKSIEDCVKDAKEVLAAIDCPLAIQGCKNIDKDTRLFEKLAEELQGANVLFVSCREENHKVLCAAAGLAYGHTLSAESAVDINLAKQLNVLVSQVGVSKDQHVMNIGAAAAGYGYEYVASTFDRVRGAALMQNDVMLQMPIITPVADEAWSVKEAIVSEEDIPEWGSREERGVQMEISTAAASVISGANAVILRHPTTVKTISAMIAGLM